MRLPNLPLFLTLAISALALTFDVPFLSVNEALGAGGALLIGQVAAAAAGSMQREVFSADPWQRIREDLPDFENVVATGRARCLIPTYAMTLYDVTLKLGGTTFTKAQITEVRLRKGSKTIWFATGSDLQSINSYFDKDEPNRATFLRIPFTSRRLKSKGAEFIAGLDMTQLGEGALWLEVLTSGATAPTLKGKATWGPIQGNSLIGKILQFTWSSSASGRRMVPLNFNGAVVEWVAFKYTLADWAASATSAVFAGNTGNGAMGAVTVAAGCKVGAWKVVIVEPGTNVGAFIVFDPDGIMSPEGGDVASAYDNDSIAFTLADGSTDFVAGDGFTITVANNSDGNVNRVEVKRNGRTVWDYECDEARFLEESYGRVPQSRFYFVDFEVDNYPDGALRTAGAASIEWYVHLTAGSEDLTIYAGIIDTPDNNSN